jgi:hypothetical protein
MKTFVGMSFVGIFLFTVVHVLKSEIPEGNREIAHIILGEVAGAALTIAAFYYGSSKGSQEKQEIIADQAKKNNNP